MTHDEFIERVKAFLLDPQPYRNLYIWHGTMEQLKSLLPPTRVQYLDVFRLASEVDRHPLASGEASELLEDRLSDWLGAWYTDSTDAPSVLVVTGPALLARYEVGLQPFYHVLTDRSMIILMCSVEDTTYDPKGRLPNYVRCEPAATLAYLSRLIEDEYMIVST